jgi:anti-anti-sigma factor
VKISVEESSDNFQITLAGQDASPENIEELKVAFQRALGSNPQVPVILDITELNYLGSEGVGVIASAHRRLSELGRRLIVRNPTAAVARVFMVTRLEKFLEIENNSKARSAGP